MALASVAISLSLPSFLLRPNHEFFPALACLTRIAGLGAAVGGLGSSLTTDFRLNELPSSKLKIGERCGRL